MDNLQIFTIERHQDAYLIHNFQVTILILHSKKWYEKKIREKNFSSSGCPSNSRIMIDED